ncbi:MAG: dihydrodipicolinate synthase family protein, partial [Planctomycetota bacterium]
DAIPTMVDFLIESNITGMYVLGSTGEGVSMTVAERRDVAAAFVAASAGRIPVMVQVGCESPYEARGLAKHASSVGADAVSAVSPLYFKPTSVATLAAAMQVVASGAPDLPFYYYHIPALTGVNLDMIDFLKLGSERIPSLRGIKFSSPLIHEFQACLEFAGDRFQIMWGVDEMLMSGLMAGATAAVGSTYNFAAGIYHRLISAIDAGDMATARKLQAQSQLLVRTFVPYGPRASQKAIMNMVGPNCGPPRVPVVPLSDQQSSELKADLERIGFFEW